MRNDRNYLLHILECIRRIEEDVRDGRPAFDKSHTIQDAVIRNLQVMAESTQRLSMEFKQAHSGTNWAAIAGLRNVLVHDYFGVDTQVIWEIVIKDIPALKAVVDGAL